MSAPPVRRPVLMLEAWHGCAPQPAAWPLGGREAALLDLRSMLFGKAMESLASCPQCGTKVEFTLDADELRALAPSGEPKPLRVETAGFAAVFRLPDTRDLEAAALVPAGERRQFILSRCLVEGEAPANGWPAEYLTAVARAMSAADPLGDLSLRLACPDCAHGWEAPFDTGAFLWTELSAWASRLMEEIHRIAASYGWTEPEILALPPQRRRFYLGCLSGSHL